MSPAIKHLIVISIHSLILIPGCTKSPTLPVNELTWTDADSGLADGVEIRIADEDAPETGPVGSRNGARCDLERTRGIAAKNHITALTSAPDARLTIRYLYPDKYQRQVSILYLNGEDIRPLMRVAGHYKSWPHRAGQRPPPKPDWCFD